MFSCYSRICLYQSSITKTQSFVRKVRRLMCQKSGRSHRQGGAHCSQQLTLLNKQNIQAVKTTHIHGRSAKIYVRFPFSILLLTPFEGTWLNRDCTNSGVTVGVKHCKHTTALWHSLSCRDGPVGTCLLLQGKSVPCADVWTDIIQCWCYRGWWYSREKMKLNSKSRMNVMT